MSRVIPAHFLYIIDIYHRIAYICRKVRSAMRKIAIISVLLLGVVLSSCLTHFFSVPQPVDVKNSKQMPKEIMGEWKKEGENEVHIIDKTSWTNITTDSLGNSITKIEHRLCDSLVVKRAGKKYFINTLEENGYWILYLGYKDNNRFFVKGLGEADTLTLKTVLKFTPDSVASGNELYYKQINLTRKQLEKLVKNGGFADTLIVFDIKSRTIKN